MDSSHGLLLHDIGHGISFREETFSLAMLVIISSMLLEYCSEVSPHLSAK
jgi:hypothetical protein